MLNSLGRTFIQSFGERNGQKALVKSLSYALFILFGISLILIWGIRFTSIWILGTSILGFVGVALFATWSMLSNILAAFILFFTQPFGIGDNITVAGDPEQSGIVNDMTLFYIYVSNEEGKVICIPNNLIIQQVVIRNDISDVASKD
jgi:small-conductance mechanosensitive channel